MKKKLETSSIVIRDKKTHRPLFRFILYNVSMSRLCSIPMFNNEKEYQEYKSNSVNYVGGDIIATALRRRGIDPHSVAFAIWDARSKA